MLKVKYIGKFLIFSILLLVSTVANSQIDYQPYPQTIDYQQSMVRIDWLKSSPRKCQIDFNHLVNFISTTNTPASGSTVTVDLYHNQNLVRSFTFPVGDGITNRIYTYKPIFLREGDQIYFIFKLYCTVDGERYVFNIYEDSRAAIKTVSVIKPTGERIVEQKPKKEIKYKALT